MSEMLQRVSEDKRRRTIDKTTVTWVCGEKDLSFKTLENDGKEQYAREMWQYFYQERARVKRIREEIEEETQVEMQGQWQLESSDRENLE